MCEGIYFISPPGPLILRTCERACLAVKSFNKKKQTKKTQQHINTNCTHPIACDALAAPHTRVKRTNPSLHGKHRLPAAERAAHWACGTQKHRPLQQANPHSTATADFAFACACVCAELMQRTGSGIDTAVPAGMNANVSPAANNGGGLVAVEPGMY